MPFKSARCNATDGASVARCMLHCASVFCMVHQSAHNCKSMKRTRGVECLVKPFDCISRGCVEIMEQDSNGRIPLILLRELLPCSSHSRFLNQSPNLVRHLGMISMQNNWETLTLEDGFILGFSFKQDIFMLFWSKSFVIRSDIFEAIVSRRSRHEWIRSASFEVLLRERFLLNQLLRKNEEYFELHDAFESILKAHDQYGMFNLKDSRTISFFKKCLDFSSHGQFHSLLKILPYWIRFRGLWRKSHQEMRKLSVRK